LSVRVPLVRATWFEHISWWNEPFVFSLSLRQLVLLLALGGLSYGLGRALFPLLSPMWAAVGGLLLFVITAALLVPRRRILQPEEVLWSWIRSRIPGVTRVRAPRRAPHAPRREDRRETIQASPGSPLQLSGKLVNPAGKPLAGVQVEILKDGKPYFLTRTDERGEYSVVFLPEEAGICELEVKPEKGEARRMLVDARPPGAPRPAPAKVEAGESPPTSSLPQARPEPSQKYVYELTPVNFFLLTPEDQLREVGTLRDFFGTLEHPIHIRIQLCTETVRLGEKEYPVSFYRFFVISDYPLDALLETHRFHFRRVMDLPPVPAVTATMRGFLGVEGGMAKTLTISRYSEEITVGFLTALYGLADRVDLFIQATSYERAKRSFNRFHTRIRALAAYERQRRRGYVPEEIQLKAAAADDLARRLAAGTAKLFRVGMNVTVLGRSWEELADKEARVRAMLGQVRLDTSRLGLIQRRLYEGSLTAWSWVDSDTLSAFFPFVSADLVEKPGLFLGVNKLTGAPVYFNPLLRKNQNTYILGSSGSGKSYATKCFLSRFLEMYPNCHLYVLDPEGEYFRALGPKGVKEMKVRIPESREEGLGLDPFNLFGTDPEGQAAVLGILSEMMELKKGSGPHSDLSVLVSTCSSLKELEAKATGELRERLRAMLKGPNGFLFRGETPQLGEKVIFNFRDLHGVPGTVGESLVDLTSFMVFNWVWREIERTPPEVPKLVVVDEAWMFLELPPAAKFLESAVRMARKRGAGLVIATHRPKDLMDIEEGASILENSATKVLLQLDPTVRKRVASELKLSPVEEEKLPTLDQGECLFLSEGQDIWMRWYAYPEEDPFFRMGPPKRRLA
jgi:hypothetical protein